MNGVTCKITAIILALLSFLSSATFAATTKESNKTKMANSMGCMSCHQQSEWAQTDNTARKSHEHLY